MTAPAITDQQTASRPGPPGSEAPRRFRPRLRYERCRRRSGLWGPVSEWQ